MAEKNSFVLLLLAVATYRTRFMYERVAKAIGKQIEKLAL